MPPVLTIVVQILGGTLFGFLGLLLMTPLTVVLMVLVKMLYVEDTLGDTTIEIKGDDEPRKEGRLRK